MRTRGPDVAGDFPVISHPHVRRWADARHAQVVAACDRADARPARPR